MFRTVHGILDLEGVVKLAEPVEFESQRHVPVTFIETDEDGAWVGGDPANLLLARPALAIGTDPRRTKHRRITRTGRRDFPAFPVHEPPLACVSLPSCVH